MRLFDKLLRSYPFKVEQILMESQKDIPPIYRGDVWTVLLKAANKSCLEFEDNFFVLDTFSEHISDRQLQVFF